MALAVPLSRAQVDAACRLQRHLDQWRRADAALERLRDAVPGFDGEACLLKALAVNTLYGANVLAIRRIAQHIEEVMAGADARNTGPDLVERIASCPGAEGGKERNFVSFASKFCHFFVEGERFPIYDSDARRALSLHLGKRVYPATTRTTYGAYLNALNHLRTEANLQCTGSELDRYLWVTGLYLKWKRERPAKNPQINVELKRVFETPDSEEAALLEVMLPESIERGFGGAFR
jgi:hypothetical protein